MDTSQTHPVLGGKAYLYRRPDSQYWQAAAYLRGNNYRTSTKEKFVSDAVFYAEEWYFDLRGQASVGELKPPSEKKITFADAAEKFIQEYSVLTKGQRSPKWIEGNAGRLRLHLLPFFGNLALDKVTASKIQEYRVFRMTPLTEKNPNAKDNRPFDGKVPAAKTLHNEIVTLRQVLKTAYPEPEDMVFPSSNVKMFKNLLEREGFRQKGSRSLLLL